MPTRHHLDKRAALLAGVKGDDDELLTTPETAQWLGVTVQWLELGRMKNFGPKFLKLSNRVIRYRRGHVRAWLKTRARQHAA